MTCYLIDVHVVNWNNSPMFLFTKYTYTFIKYYGISYMNCTKQHIIPQGVSKFQHSTFCTKLYQYIFNFHLILLQAVLIVLIHCNNRFFNFLLKPFQDFHLFALNHFFITREQTRSWLILFYKEKSNFEIMILVNIWNEILLKWHVKYYGLNSHMSRSEKGI